MNKSKTILFLSTLIVVVGCTTIYGGTYRFDGPGSFQDFAQVRYQCSQETSSRVSGAFANQYGGAASSSVTPECSRFTACLAAKGYYRNPEGRLDASAIPVSCH
jgi:hypothetical protein